MKVLELVQDFKSKKIQNTKADNKVISNYLNQTLEIKTYLPFEDKRRIAEMVVSANTKMIDGIKKNDSISQYISFVVAAITAHTNLEFNKDDVYADYDALAESGILQHLIEEFRASYDELDVLLKMALASELEDNNINVLVGKFLNGLLGNIDVITNALGAKIDGFDMGSLLGDFKKEDLTALSSFLNTFNK